MNFIRKFVAYMQLRQAIKKADNAHLQDHDRYFVIAGGHSEKGRPLLIVLDRRNFKLLKKHKYILRGAKVKDLIRESFYFTPCMTGYGGVDEKGRKVKLQQYYAWYNAEIKKYKQERILKEN